MLTKIRSGSGGGGGGGLGLKTSGFAAEKDDSAPVLKRHITEKTYRYGAGSGGLGLKSSSVYIKFFHCFFLKNLNLNLIVTTTIIMIIINFQK